MAGEIWGQTRNSGDRTIGPGDLTKRRSGGPSQLWCTDMGTDTMSGIKSRPDGLSRVWHPDMGTDTRFGRPTFNEVTERAHDGRDMGTDTMLRYTDRERSTSNVQLSTLKGVTEKAHGGRERGQARWFGIPIGNVQRTTFNAQLSKG